jgi:protein SCO1
MRWTPFAIALAIAMAAPTAGWAQPSRSSVLAGGKVQPVQEVPHLDDIGVDEQLEQAMPLDLTFTDHRGRQVRLRDYVDGERPVLLTFAYYTCPVLCSMVLDATTRGITPLDWTAGDEYEVVTISIDPRDTPQDAAKKRAEVVEGYGRSDDGWHFLVGSADNIRKATEAAGFRYFYMEDEGQYAHPAVLMFLTPEGKLARYLYGLSYPPNDVRMALLEASKGRSISTVEKVIMYCYQYDPNSKGYALVAFRVMQIGGGLTAAVLALFLVLLWRRDMRRRRESPPIAPRATEAHG